MISSVGYHVFRAGANIDLQLCLTPYDIVMQYYISDIPELRLNILPGDIIFLRGNLGSGKTTLTQEILFQRGISREKIKSPTYTYFQKYIAPLTNETFYHFDLYRIGEYEVFLNI